MTFQPKPGHGSLSESMVEKLNDAADCLHRHCYTSRAEAVTEAAAKIEDLEELLWRARESLPACYVNLHAAITAALSNTEAREQ